MFPHICIKIAWEIEFGPKKALDGSYPISTARGRPDLVVPWEWHFGQKLIIYVEIANSEHFWFYVKIVFYDFLLYSANFTDFQGHLNETIDKPNFFPGILYTYTHVWEHVVFQCDQLIFQKTKLTLGNCAAIGVLHLIIQKVNPQLISNPWCLL